MRVYRVGHAEKVRRIPAVGVFPAGPYSGLSWPERTEGLAEMSYAHSGPGSERHHPAPQWDSALGDMSRAEVCGFVSLDALLDWFDTWLRVLDEADFRVWVYDVPDASVRVGSLFGQLVFTAADAVPVEDFAVPLEDSQLALFDPSHLLPGQ